MTGEGSPRDLYDGIDPVTLEVVRNALVAIAEEMNATLVRTSHSPNIKERRDCSCALFDANGEMVSQAETIPVHLGAMPFSVRSALERFPPDTLSPGDAVLLNDPFHGGAHLPDLTLVSPIFEGDRPIAYAANRAHHADVGGARAASVAADSTEIYQEGLRIPPVKLFRGGEADEDLLSVLFANVRTPDERRGDLRAQEAANETGRRRTGELVERRGSETIRDAMAAVTRYSERRMRSAIAALPDGEYAFEDVIEDDGRGNEDLAICALVTIEDDSVTVDFDGSAQQTEGPLNAPFAVTASATYFALRCLTDPEIPPNAGNYRPIEIVAPGGTIVNADPPAAVVGGNLEVSQRIVDVVFGAFAEELPERVTAAGQGTMNNLTLGGIDPETNEPYAFYETQGGGFGGRAGADGMDGVHVHMSNTLNTPAEVLQTAYPLVVERYEFREESGGAGAFRGGLGLRRDVRVEGTATMSLLAERRRCAPYGIAGGKEGSTGEDVRVTDGVARHLAAKSVHELDPGDVISLRTPGGGGYGDPADRDRDAIERDVRNGVISPETAWSVYGVDGERTPTAPREGGGDTNESDECDENDAIDAGDESNEAGQGGVNY